MNSFVSQKKKRLMQKKYSERNIKIKLIAECILSGLFQNWREFCDDFEFNREFTREARRGDTINALASC